MGESRGSSMEEHVIRTHGQSQRGKDGGWEFGVGVVEESSGGKMETTVLEQQ